MKNENEEEATGKAPVGELVRRVKQIAVAGTIENCITQSELAIIALCEDGTMCMTTNRTFGEKWDEIKLPPA